MADAVGKMPRPLIFGKIRLILHLFWPALTCIIIEHIDDLAYNFPDFGPLWLCQW